ncbi:NYN domain-containing protein [Fusarium oxysporum]|nr:NYN domain-containing protein [Fusarium oxysporum]
MAAVAQSIKLAVLIDADNTSPNAVCFILAEIAKFGTASVKRAYGDWTSPGLNRWKTPLLENSIQPMQQFAYTTGKNSTDSAMIIDAMDLLYSKNFDGFCIVSSDSDFTRLASRIRESGLVVYGCGERKTPKAFVTACDRFIYVENLMPTTEAARPVGSDGPSSAAGLSASSSSLPVHTLLAKRKRVESRLEKEASIDAQAAGSLTIETREVDEEVIDLLWEAVEIAADEEGWAVLSKVGSLITKWHPDFDSRTYGFRKLKELMASTSLFEIIHRSPGLGKPELAYARCSVEQWEARLL